MFSQKCHHWQSIKNIDIQVHQQAASMNMTMIILKIGKCNQIQNKINIVRKRKYKKRKRKKKKYFVVCS